MMDAAPARTEGRYSAAERLLAAALVVLAPLALLFIAFQMVWGMLTALLLFPVLPPGANNALIRIWSRLTLAALGIRLEAGGSAPVAPAGGSGALLVMNHISWADVFLVAAVAPARFVAKAEIARWPVIGRFAAAVGTIYVERGRRHAVKRVNDTVIARLQSGQDVGIFPEGTTTDGSCLLRFHANLIQAGLDAQAPIVPVALQYYRSGRPTDAAAFVGDDTLAASLWRILITPRLSARLLWLPAVATAGHTRQGVAQCARAAIAAALALPERESSTADATLDGDAGEMESVATNGS